MFCMFVGMCCKASDLNRPSMLSAYLEIPNAGITKDYNITKMPCNGLESKCSTFWDPGNELKGTKKIGIKWNEGFRNQVNGLAVRITSLIIGLQCVQRALLSFSLQVLQAHNERE